MTEEEIDRIVKLNRELQKYFLHMEKKISDAILNTRALVTNQIMEQGDIKKDPTPAKNPYDIDVREAIDQAENTTIVIIKMLTEDKHYVQEIKECFKVLRERFDRYDNDVVESLLFFSDF